MSTDKPVILTPSLAAEWFSEYGPNSQANQALSDVIDGRTRVIEPMSETQAREAFRICATKVGWYLSDWGNYEIVWLAALRHARVLADEGEGT